MNPWMFNKIIPNDEEKKRMFAIAVEIMIKRTMNLHDYKFENNIYRQKQGGSIGLDLTGVVADIYMCHWDIQLIEKMRVRDINVKLYKRYKDDIDLIMENKTEYNRQFNRKEFEETTINEVKILADSIHPSIKVTVDISSNYDDNRLPILDLKVWIGEISSGQYKVITSHYMKDVSSRAVINSKSSHPTNMKRSVMINEILRILRNCSKYLDWEETAAHISYFVRRLQFSGYDQEFRFKVVKDALNKYDRMIEGITIDANRNSDEVTAIRNATTKKKKRDWYDRGNKYDGVIFVQPTKESKLKREIQKCAERNKVRVKIVEKVESSIKKEIQKSDPFKKQRCERQDCMICKLNLGINCRERGCVYEFECTLCKRKYRGQTGNSAYERTNQHFEDWKRKLEGSPLYKHAQLYHNGGEFPVEIRIIKRCFGDPTKRQISEAVLIDELTDEQTMNSKNEWSYIRLSKVNELTSVRE
jgi:hypothetical protein